MTEKYLIINQLAPILEENKSAIIGLEKYYNKEIPIPHYVFNLLQHLKFMIIDEEEEELFHFFDYPVQISVQTIKDNILYCMLEDVNCFE